MKRLFAGISLAVLLVVLASTVLGWRALPTPVGQPPSHVRWVLAVVMALDLVGIILIVLWFADPARRRRARLDTPIDFSPDPPLTDDWSVSQSKAMPLPPRADASNTARSPASTSAGDPDPSSRSTNPGRR